MEIGGYLGPSKSARPVYREYFYRQTELQSGRHHRLLCGNDAFYSRTRSLAIKIALCRIISRMRWWGVCSMHGVNTTHAYKLFIGKRHEKRRAYEAEAERDTQLQIKDNSITRIDKIIT
jgi:hypothetical protein